MIKMTKKQKMRFHTKTLRHKSETLDTFQKKITIMFLEILIMIKLFHWKTHNYATHKSTDELYTKLNSSIDEFIEVLLGKTGKRTTLTNWNHIKLIDLNSNAELHKKITDFNDYLIGLNNNKALKVMNNTDLFSIRDVILSELNQFLYLLSFE